MILILFIGDKAAYNTHQANPDQEQQAADHAAGGSAVWTGKPGQTARPS